MALVVDSVLVYWAVRLGLLGEPWRASPPPDYPNGVAHLTKTRDQR